jgi:hypothetical protein
MDSDEVDLPENLEDARTTDEALAATKAADDGQRAHPGRAVAVGEEAITRDTTAAAIVEEALEALRGVRAAAITRTSGVATTEAGR